MGLWKEIRKEGSQLSNYMVFSLVMEEESDFDWTLGVEMRLCAALSPLCLLWRFQKRSWWQRLRTLQLRGGVGVLVFLGLSMMGR